jgi:hypothetical protein
MPEASNVFSSKICCLSSPENHTCAVSTPHWEYKPCLTAVRCWQQGGWFLTESAHPAVSVPKSQDCGNIQKPAVHAPKFSKGKMEWYANGSTDQSHLRMWHLLRTGQNICQAPWAFDRIDMCAIKVFNQSINQSINHTHAQRALVLCCQLSGNVVLLCREF